ncbi:EF-hand domain-containing protein [Saccharothrix sp. HUAS TT1]|uniref:EF-hand domain-containing protein n=1 Tax=unclassified Saccharothrix TaxID=2593673 RepID=UPI00345BB6D8
MTATVQDVITAKLERAFDTLDANQDGFLDWSDHQALADRYVAAYRLGRDDRRARALYSFFQAYWLELLRHSAVDGDRLTKAEFVQANRIASVDTSRLNVVDGAGHVMFDVVDVDGDNEMSKDEFARCMNDVWQITAPDAMRSFTAMDTDGDGVISRHEFVRAIREHFFSTDPDAPGSMFFGHV